MELYIEQNNKNVSLCFMNNETFKKLIDGKTETELVTIANAIYESALKVLEQNEKAYGVLSRQISKMDKNSVVYKMALKKQNSINKTIESINESLDALEKDTEEFCWIKYMINVCLGNINAIEEEE